ncbi:hypothetical protein HED63_05235 [Ochrobactrum cytisi]|nr:hypothetical protein [Brucella cytisi]
MSVATLRPAAHLGRNSIHKRDEWAFIINETLVDTIGKEKVLAVFCDWRYDESKFHFNIVLESPVYRRRERGQTERTPLRKCRSLRN